MIKKDDKRILYWLISLSQEEYDYFSQLNSVAVRFSKFEDDFKSYPGDYYTEQELNQKVLETKEALKDCWIVAD